MVGVDGSPSSKAALRWAARQAGLTGGRLHAVTAWELPSYYGWAPMLPYDEDLAATAGKALTAAVHSVFGDERSKLDLVESVVPGHPAQVLIDLSARCGLLVIGSRGHGAFTGTLIGSVSQQCVQHARCPVVVVRGS
ncbi:universal stress protein [Actinoplanes sichuanensis]|uniref:Universal stress protein n=1 Tax=Actinoplanes sichuanensis TaxID=512349 RepID=A0ABW4AM33_9ACTN|nr:universal stress protein [Actinoplanes sichuanensis]BEL05996.1 universal stress protein [Actinoplanes sichuanensis]